MQNALSHAERYHPEGLVPKKFAQQSARGLAQSKTLSRVKGREQFRQVLDCGSPLALSMPETKGASVFASKLADHSPLWRNSKF